MEINCGENRAHKNKYSYSKKQLAKLRIFQGGWLDPKGIQRYYNCTKKRERGANAHKFPFWDKKVNILNILIESISSNFLFGRMRLDQSISCPVDVQKHPTSRSNWNPLCSQISGSHRKSLAHRIDKHFKFISHSNEIYTWTGS